MACGLIGSNSGSISNADTVDRFVVSAEDLGEEVEADFGEGVLDHTLADHVVGRWVYFGMTDGGRWPCLGSR